ncbi:MAG: 50S ribosomal protein L25/general stress protein Ctc [Burkholderiales bacterium]|jgi:large subunit ribosomal protein L25|nr:50S ribosomal protein L25/general stress protein Ctc [Burkholderiales bacterium]
MKFEVTATVRTAQGTGASRRLRRAGRVPGILYGAKAPAVTLELDHDDLYHMLKQEAFHASILTLEVDGKKEQVLLRDVQMHPWKPQVLHVDFQRVDPDTKIHMKVPLHFVGADVAPGVKLAGGNITHVMSEAEVLCLPKDLPEYIEVDLSGLQAGHSLHLSQIKLPPGVEFVELRHGNDAAVASCVVPRGAAEETAEGSAA